MISSTLLVGSGNVRSAAQEVVRVFARYAYHVEEGLGFTTPKPVQEFMADLTDPDKFNYPIEDMDTTELEKARDAAKDALVKLEAVIRQDLLALAPDGADVYESRGPGAAADTAAR